MKQTVSWKTNPDITRKFEISENIWLSFSGFANDASKESEQFLFGPILTRFYKIRKLFFIK